MKTDETVSKQLSKISRRSFVRTAGHTAAAIGLLGGSSVAKATADKCKSIPSEKENQYEQSYLIINL